MPPAAEPAHVGRAGALRACARDRRGVLGPVPQPTAELCILRKPCHTAMCKSEETAEIKWPDQTHGVNYWWSQEFDWWWCPRCRACWQLFTRKGSPASSISTSPHLQRKYCTTRGGATGGHAGAVVASDASSSDMALLWNESWNFGPRGPILLFWVKT